MQTKCFKRGHTKNMQRFEAIILEAVLPVGLRGLYCSAFPNTQFQHSFIKSGI